MLSALGVEHKALYGTPEDKAAPLDIFGGKSARFAMQRLGTEWGRSISPDIWVNAWRKRVETLSDALATPCFVADDLRFPNEAATIKALGGEVWCVVRSWDDFERVPHHASEDFAAIPHDRVILNDSSLGALEVAVAKALKRRQVAA